MAVGQRFAPRRVVMDVSESSQPIDSAKFIKNLVYELGDSSGASAARGGQETVYKPIQSVLPYLSNLVLPEGTNFPIGGFTFKQRNEAYALIYNSNSNHVIYRIDGTTQTYQIVDQGAVLNFQLDPQYFVHKGGATIDEVFVEDPATGDMIERVFFVFTDGYNPQRQYSVLDAIATNGYDPAQYHYFSGNYDPQILINVGLPSSEECITITEIPRTAADAGLNDNLAFNTWQFRITPIDVWGRPAEHGMISNEYVPGINDCLAASNSLPRCLNLTFDAGNPLWDKIQVEYRNCNSLQWYIDDILFLYNGSNIGSWWLRSRNPEVNFNSATNTISYTFCRTKECNVVPQTETSRNFNPLARTSQAVSKVNQFLGFGNNKYGFSPFSSDLLSNFTVSVIPPTANPVNSRNITIYVPIYNDPLKNYQSVRKNGTTNYIWGDNDARHGGAIAYDQYFANPQQSGFVGYLLGDGNLAISTQVYAVGNQLFDDPAFDGQLLSPTGLTFQKFVFNNMPAGTYIFRLASHLSDPSAGDNYTSTSTTVWGVCPFNNQTFQISPDQRIASQELIINVCSGDYNTLNENQILVIADMGAFVENQSEKATCGYIYETQINGTPQNPMELMSVNNPSGGASGITDHNGFYWFHTRGTGVDFTFTFYYKCHLATFGQHEGNVGMTFKNIFIDQYGQNNQIPWADYFTTPCNRVLIQGTAFLSGQNIGIPNATIVLSRGQTTTTDDEGNFTLIAHDQVGVDARVDILIFANGICNFTAVGGGCVAIKNIVIRPCITCATRTLNVGQYTLQYLVEKGLLSGGVYGIGAVGKDWLKRETFVQDLGYATIPSIVQSQAIAPSVLQVAIDPSALFPPETTEISFWITAETTIAEYIDWIVDRFDLIDNTGNINTVAPTQIRIWYSSLIEFNKQNNYNTTCAWNFIPQGQNVPVTSDKVQFIMNGDGTFFTKAIIGLVKYDTVGQYFLIDYTPDLAGLVANGLIRLFRPNVCTDLTTAPYYEIPCSTIEIVNQAATQNKITLNAFDTYYLSRQIPVPIPTTPQPTVQSIATSVTTGNTVVTTTEIPVPTTYADAQRIFGFRFEHNAPSNFWGSGCANYGRISSKNPYEAVLYKRDEIALSGTLSSNGQLNYTNYFDESNNFSFNSSGLNGIVGIYPEFGIIVILGQTNCFVVGFNDTIPTVNELGQLTIPSNANQFGNPQEKVGGHYGCMLIDKNSISSRQGMVAWIDTTEMVVCTYDYHEVTPISVVAGVDGYVRAKCVSVNQSNLTGMNRYFTGVINCINNEYLLTDQMITGQNFVNQLRQVNVDVSETMIFGVYTKTFKGHYGFTPQLMLSLEGEKNDNQLFTFINGIPYYHYSAFANQTFGTVYGTVVERVFDVIINLDPFKKKKPLSIAQYSSGSLYFCDSCTASDGQNTRMLISAWLQANFGWWAPFYMNLATLLDSNRPLATGVNALLDGDAIVSNWIRVRLIGSPDTNTSYSELQGISLQVMASEPSGEIK